MSSDHRFSEAAFFQFIDFIGKKGLVKPSKAKNWKGAVTQLLSILDEHEKADLRNLDVDQIIERYANIKNTSVTPSSLKIYSSRFKGAHADFISWAQDPVNYKPSGKTASSSSSAAKNTKKTSKKTAKPAESRVEQPEPRPAPASAPTHAESVVFPIPISGGRVITINNLPYELSKVDAEKISAVVRALAIQEPKE